MHPVDATNPPIDDLTFSLGTRALAVDRMAALFSALHDELRRIARQHRQSLQAGATLDTTGLVHEAYVKLSTAQVDAPIDRAHFFALAAQTMRQIIIDRARRTLAGKRGGGAVHVALADITLAGSDDRVSEQALAVHQALEQLEALSPRLAEVVSMRFFAGMTEDEIADAVGRDPATVRRDWAKARAWLYRTLSDPVPDGAPPE